MLICMLFKKKKYIYNVKELILSKEALTALFTVIIYLIYLTIYLRKQSNTQENLNSRNTAILVSTAGCWGEQPWQDQHSSGIQGSSEATISGRRKTPEVLLNNTAWNNYSAWKWKGRSKSVNGSGQALYPHRTASKASPSFSSVLSSTSEIWF